MQDSIFSVALKSSLLVLITSLLCFVWMVWLVSLVSCIVMRASQGLLSRSSVFYIFFWNISDPLHDVNISSISLFRGKEWSNGVMCGRHLRLTIESPGHCLGIVLGSMTIFMPFTGVLLLTLNWFLSRDTFCFWFPSG